MIAENPLPEGIVSPGSFANYLEAHPEASRKSYEEAVKQLQLATAAALGVDHYALHELGPERVLAKQAKESLEIV